MRSLLSWGAELRPSAWRPTHWPRSSARVRCAGRATRTTPLSLHPGRRSGRDVVVLDPRLPLQGGAQPPLVGEEDQRAPLHVVEEHPPAPAAPALDLVGGPGAPARVRLPDGVEPGRRAVLVLQAVEQHV